MKQYAFSINGKILVTLKFLGILCVSIFFMIFINSVTYFYYIMWIPFLYLTYIVICGIFYVWTTKFYIDENKLTAKSALNLNKEIFWNEIKDIKTEMQKDKPARMVISNKNNGELFILENTIDNFQELSELILGGFKKSKSSDILDRF